MIFDRTDLRISGSRAKFDAKVDGEVRLTLAPPKLHQINKKLIWSKPIPNHIIQSVFGTSGSASFADCGF